MATEIKQLKNGTYSVRVYAKHKDALGKRKSKYQSGIKSVATARILAKEFEEELERYVDDDFTLAEANEMYLLSRESKVEPTTFARFKFVYKPIIERLGHIKIKNINNRVVQSYVDDRQKDKSKNSKERIKKATVEREVRYIKTIINWLIANDYLEYNKIKRIEYTPDEEEFEATTLSIEQVADVLKNLKMNYYNLYIPVLISVTTSARRGEALALKWSDIDWVNNTITFHSNFVEVGNKTVDKSKMKTKSSRRIIAMCDFLRGELLEHQNICVGLNSDYVCATPFSSDVPMTPSNLTKKYHKYILDTYGIHMRLHDLRHTFNQLAYENGVDISTRAMIMGHSNEKLTQKVYTHNSILKSKEATNKLGNKIAESFYDCE